MLRGCEPTISSELDQMVVVLLREDQQFAAHDRRSIHRETLVRPIMIQLQNVPDASPINAMTRNISGSGMGVFSDVEFFDGQTARITVTRLQGPSYTVVATCRWCKAYGMLYLSGWNFSQLLRTTH
jgi:PilZ domain